MWNPLARTVHLPPERRRPAPADAGTILVVSAGTSDLPVAEEAAVVAEAFGHRVERLVDVGRGRHPPAARVRRPAPARADVVIVVAGMEGALPSVVGGLVAGPVIAVPTSVGYGASFGGLAALLGMLNSCAAGRHRGEHRQRLRRGRRGQPDLPPMTIRTVVEKSEPRFIWLDVVRSRPPRSWPSWRRDYGLHPLSVSDCLDPEHLPKYELFENHTFVILRAIDESGPHRRRHGPGAHAQDRGVLRAGFLITIHRKDQPWLTALQQRCLVGLPSKQAARSEGIQAHLLAQLFNAALDTYQRPLEAVEARLDRFDSRRLRGPVEPRAAPSAPSCARSTWRSAR